jgi:TPR repeat protein
MRVKHHLAIGVCAAALFASFPPAVFAATASTQSDAAEQLPYLDSLVAQANTILKSTGKDRDVKLAVALLLEAVRNNRTDAMRTLAEILTTGDGDVAADPARAEELLKQAIDAGDVAWGAFGLGNFYLAETPLKDVGNAAAAFQKAADAGNTAAMRTLADIYAAGRGNVAADPARAEALLNQAVEKGDIAWGAYALGDFYRLETPLKSASKAAAAYQKAADAGNTSAMRVLGGMLTLGIDDVPPDPSKAEALFKQAIAAGDVAWGAYGLGEFYRSNTPLRDPAQAVAAYQQAVDAGNTTAMRVLAALMTNGDGPVAADPQRAEALLKQALAAGDVAAAAAAMGDFYLAKTPLRDPQKAVKAYQQAVDAGSTAAMRMLADVLVKGIDKLAADPERAEALLHQAIAAGDVASGEMALGEFYRRDTPLKDIAKAVDAYQRASDAGNTAAMRTLAGLLTAGVPEVAADPARAEALLQKAVAAGDVSLGAAALGDFYVADTPMKDVPKALAAYQMAADAGNTAAMRTLAGLLTDGPSADPARAEVLLKRAVAAGDVEWGAYALGNFYRASTPLQDSGKAVAAYQQSVDAGNTVAMRTLAGVLLNGEGNVAGDPSRSEALLKQAVAAGDVAGASAVLGGFYRAPTPLQDNRKAVDAYQQAVDAGNSDAAFSLAAVLTEGKHPAADLDRARGLLEQALDGAAANSAALALGDLYSRSDYPSRSLAKAIDYYERAASAGVVDAHIDLVKIGSQNFKDPSAVSTAVGHAREAAKAVGQDAVLNLIFDLPSKAVVAIAQRLLVEAGETTSVNGVQGKQTAAALANFCSKNQIDDCSQQFITRAFLRAALFDNRATN